MIYRIDTRAKLTGRGTVDPMGEAVRHQIAEFGAHMGPIEMRRIFLLDTDAPRARILDAAEALLADPLVESAEEVRPGTADKPDQSRVEVHLKPGVMDPVAASTEMALKDMGLPVRGVRTGRAYLISGKIDRAELSRIAARVLANGVIESIHFSPYIPEKFETLPPYTLKLRHVALCELSDAELTKLSREGHLFLSLAEMKAIQAYFRTENREPTDIELETLAQTWSEHCVHKTLKSAVDVEVRDAAGKPVGNRHYGNLIKDTIFASTRTLMQTPAGKAFCLSVFADNAGVVAFDETDAVCFKVETHNHPSAIEPYGGSATGAGGVIRDILGTGLGARPVANTDVFCVASPNQGKLPRGVIHPRRVLQQVVAGVRDYGNRMGIPTVNGAVYFDDRYVGNPLVFCGCVGLIPRSKIDKAAAAGDAIVVVGGRTGRDGIHGATFSSAELTDTHADEFSHAVQIGNAITEKKMADVILAARDRKLFTAITDCGAGGLSSAVGEMAEKLGATVELDKVPLKYAGLRYDEIWISEAQERMVLSVPTDRLDELLELAGEEDVEATVIGTFGTPDQTLRLRYQATEVGRLAMEFLHGGIPMPRRSAIVVESAGLLLAGRASDGGRILHSPPTSPAAPPALARPANSNSSSAADRLLALLADPNIASKHWVIRQYDHEVQGGSVIKPLIGPRQAGPSDAAVLRPKLGSHRGIALGCGLSPQIEDPYEMSLAAIDEAIRNVVAVGADPANVAILDNFCWPSVDDPITMGTLVRACEACHDAALAYRIPFISGKDSLHNQFTDSETGTVIRIPRTLLISAIAVLPDVRKCLTMDLKSPENRLALVQPAEQSLAGRAALHTALASAIAAGLVRSCHDCSEGGIAVAVAEMAIASGLGVDVSLPEDFDVFAEIPGRYVIEFAPGDFDALQAKLGVAQFFDVGVVTADPVFAIGSTRLDVQRMFEAWRGTLDW
jgi:phosphoribosylformylglycinamidine (FGAM) synthase-like enzyme/phosphoribosylformylglycinamidine (FGAM) synthase PurS component